MSQSRTSYSAIQRTKKAILTARELTKVETDALALAHIDI